MGGNIAGRNFLGGSLMDGNFPGGNFPGWIVLIPFQTFMLSSVRLFLCHFKQFRLLTLIIIVFIVKLLLIVNNKLLITIIIIIIMIATYLQFIRISCLTWLSSKSSNDHIFHQDYHLPLHSILVQPKVIKATFKKLHVNPGAHRILMHDVCRTSWLCC